MMMKIAVVAATIACSVSFFLPVQLIIKKNYPFISISHSQCEIKPTHLVSISHSEREIKPTP